MFLPGYFMSWKRNWAVAFKGNEIGEIFCISHFLYHVVMEMHLNFFLNGFFFLFWCSSIAVNVCMDCVTPTIVRSRIVPPAPKLLCAICPFIVTPSPGHHWSVFHFFLYGCISDTSNDKYLIKYDKIWGISSKNVCKSAWHM